MGEPRLQTELEWEASPQFLPYMTNDELHAMLDDSERGIARGEWLSLEQVMKEVAPWMKH